MEVTVTGRLLISPLLPLVDGEVRIVKSTISVPATLKGLVASSQKAKRDLIFGAVLAFFLGRTVLGDSLSPFAPAVYGGFRSSGGSSSVVLGICALLGSATLKRWDLLGYHALAILLMTFFMRTLKDRTPIPVVNSLLCAGIVAVSKTAAAAAAQGLSLYVHLTTVLEGLCAFVACMLISSAFTASPGFSLGASGSDALMILCLLSLGGLADVTVAGFSVQTIAVMGFTLIAAYIGGPGAGAIAGLSGGLVLVLTAKENPMVFGLLGVAGLLAGVGGQFGQVEAILGYLASGLLVSLYTMPADTVTKRFLEQASACVFIIFVNSRVSKRLTLMFPALAKNGHRERTPSQTIEPYKLKVAAVSHALSQMSSLFRQSSDTLGTTGFDNKPVRAQIPTPELGQHGQGQVSAKDILGVETSQEIIKQVSERVCMNCEQRKYCWEAEFGETFRAFCELLREMAFKGRLTSADDPTNMADKCSNFGEIVSELNHWKEIDRLQKRLDVLDSQTKECLAFQYRCLGTLLAPARPSRTKRRGERKHALRLTVKGGTVAAENAQSGDMWVQHQLNSGETLVVLSDGMGKGRLAARQSEETLNLMKSLLDCGLDYDSCVSFLNSALFLACRPDSFVAIDCLLVDKETERAHFHKFGSPPSFIRKAGGDVMVVRGARPPAGALNAVSCLATSEPIAPGDCILLVSDGVFRSSPVPARAEHLIVSRLRRQKDSSLEATVKGLLTHGRPGGAKPADDVTVVGILVEKV